MAAFVDTNVLLYAFASGIKGSVEKVAIAKKLVSDLIENDEIVVSTQVLNEFTSNALRKGTPPLTPFETSVIVQRLAQEEVVSTDASLIVLAIDRVQQSHISYWDALIVEAALRSGATILYTEDMHHGTHFGPLELRNPFLG